MKADRLVSLLLLLQSAERRTARELARRLEVSERTIYRDVDALSTSGIPVYAERGAVGGIALSEGYRRALMHFGDDEIRALFVGGTAVLADLGLGQNLERALEKLRGGLGDVQRRAAERARGRIHIDQRRWNQSDPPVERLALLRRAVWDDRCVDLGYEDRSRVRSMRRVDPYGLVSKAGVWYLIARTPDGFRSFRVDRIFDAQECNERFERAPDFDLDAHWRETASKMMGVQDRFTVTMRVDPDALSMIVGYWPSDPVSSDDPCVLRVHFSGERAAVSYLVTWGDSVELLEPMSLAPAVVAHARRLIERYASLPTMR
jgi:predicted DNA-binding transcriptional regulator YafY